MKTTRLLLFAAVFGLLVAAGSLHAASTAADKSQRIDVSFFEAEKFTDVKDSAAATERGREHYLSEFRDHLQKLARDYLPEGYKLSVTITDIDLAGEFEPWRSSASDIRIVRSIYPPRINLAYKLTDAEGTAVKQGEQKLQNLTFEAELTLDRSDPLRYDKELLNDWFRTEFGQLKKKA